MESFFKLVELKTHLKARYNEKLNTEDQILKPQSNKTYIKTFIETTERELKQQGDISDNKRYNNLSKGEGIVLKELSDLADLIITKAGKGGAVVIIKDNINEVHRQLKNKDHYKRLKKDPTTTSAILGNDTIQRFKKEKLLKENNCRWLDCVKPKNYKILYAAKHS